MSCLQITFTREAGMSASVERVGSFATTLTRADSLTARLEREDGLSATLTRKAGLSCQLWQVCSASIRKPYLEISPTVVWVLAGYTENDVFSNTNWAID